MRMKIIDNVSIAKIYINGKEIDGVVKYKIKRSLNDFPRVELTLKPCFIDIDLSDSIIRSRLSLIAPQLRCQIEHLIGLFRTKKMLSRKTQKHRKS